MTWTYTPGGADPVSQVRALVGDTVAAMPRLQDEEIAAILAAQPSVPYAAYQAARALVARYAGMVTSSGGGTSKQWDQLTRHYTDLAAALRRDALRSGAAGAIPYAGGLSIAEKLAQESDTDAVQPAFRREYARPPFDGQGYGYTQPGDEP